jgi:hypothetical protein
MRIVIDTGVLWHPMAMDKIAEQKCKLILPIVAYSERLRQLTIAGRKPRELMILLQALGIEVEPLDMSEVEKYSIRIPNDSWEELARDSYIAGHVGDADLLWTTNPKDFLEIGVPEHQVVVVP